MTAVRFVEACKYGAKLCGFLLGVAVVGGGGLGLGYRLAWPEVGPVLGAGSPQTAPLAGGAVLAILGGFVLVVGFLAAGYKLLADGVSRGVGAGPVADVESGGDASGGVTDDGEPSIPSVDPADAASGAAAATESPGAAGVDEPSKSPGADTADGARAGSNHGEEADFGGAAGQSSGGGENPAVSDEGSPAGTGTVEPTAEEIAFGSQAEASPDGDPAEEWGPPGEGGEDSDEPTSRGEAVEPAGTNAAGDPLADPDDE